MIQRQSRRLRPADRRQILEMARAGMTDSAISRATTWSESTIQHVRREAGFTKPEKCAPIPAATISRMREMRAAGCGVMAIVAATGHGQSAVRQYTRAYARPRARPALAAVPWTDQPVIVAPTVDDRWSELLAGRCFGDAMAFDAGRGKVARIAIDTGLGRSSMAYA